MKDFKQPQPVPLKLFISRSLLILICLLINYVAIAQQVTTVDAPKNDATQVYMEKHKNTPVVKFFQNHPSDQEAKVALRYAMIIENPKEFGVSEEDLEMMKIHLNDFITATESINSMMQKGASYELAKENYTRQQLIQKETIGKTNDKSNLEPSSPIMSAPDTP